MDRATKSEIIVVGAAGAFVVWLWLMNHRAGAGTGLETLPALANGQSPIPGAAPLWDLPAPVAGWEGHYTPLDASFAGPDLSLPLGQPGACGCSNANTGDNTFGSAADLAAWLSSTGQITPPGKPY